MTHLKHLSLLPFLVFLSPASTFAGECDGAQTQFEINQCTARVYETADRQLNEVLSQVQRTFSRDDYGRRSKAKLLDSQRAWIAYRNAECDGSVGQEWEGGTGRPMAVNGCATTLTVERTKRLRERFLSR